jgi:asparaginyl-tRNA synthetase
MIEAEAAFIDSLDELMKVMENFIKHVTSEVMEKCADDVETLHVADGNEGIALPGFERPFEIMTYDQATDILDRHSGNFVSQVRKGQALGKEHEHYLVKHCGDCPVFVVDWPHDIKPFYMKQSLQDDSKVFRVNGNLTSV